MANKSGNPNWRKGKPRPEKAGRKKGTPNKISKDIKEMILNALNDPRVGGEEGFIQWIIANKRNKEMFYSWLMKMLPSNVGIEGNIKQDHRLSIVDLKKSLKACDESRKRDWEYQKKHVVNMEKIS